MKKTVLILFLFFVCFCAHSQIGERTQIRGFMDVGANYNISKKQMNFQLGEQDLFITSDLSNHISFLGESVLKYNDASTTKFAVSLERAIIKYNYYGNHNFFAGKVHTALNYWNDTYHHGRLFFPTVGRPELFNQTIIPLHTTGFGLSGQDLTKLKIGYTLMAGNGLGSTDIADNNMFKALVAAVHFKPIDGLRLGASYYLDHIDGSVHNHGGGVTHVHHLITQTIMSGSIAYFKNKMELLVEGSNVSNSTDSLGSRITNGVYAYVGYRIKDIIVPYARYDNTIYQKGEMFFTSPNTEAVSVGLRYEINYLTTVKLEYQYKRTGYLATALYTDNLFLQIAIGF